MNRPVNFSPRRRLRGKPLRNYRIWVLLALLLGLLLGGQSVQAQAWSVSASGVSSDSATIHVNNMPVSSQVSIVVFELFGGSIHCGHCPGDRNIVFRERPWFSGSRQWTISGLKPATNYQLTAQILMTDNSDAIDTNRKVARFSTAFEFPWISIDSITDTSARLNFLAIPKGTRFFDIVLSPKPTSGNWRHWLHANENEFPYSPYILKSLDPGTQYTVSVAPKNAAMPSGSSLSTSLSGIGNVFSPESVAFTTTGVKFVPTALPDNITYVLRDPGDGRIYIQITGGVAGAYAYSSSPLNCSIEAQVSFLASKVPRSISYCFGYEQPYRLVLRAYRDIGGKIGARQIEVIAEKVITGVTAARSDSPPVEPEPEELPPIAFSVGIVNSTEATISWIAVSGASGYRLEYRGGDKSSGAYDLGAGTTEKRLTGLSPGVLYTVKVSANLPGGATHSGQTSFTMPAAPTSTPIPQKQIIGQGEPDPPPQDNSPPELPDEAPPPQQQQQQQPSTQGGLLGEVEAKIAHHRDNTGRSDLVAAFSAARDALTGKGSVDDALAAATYQNALWDRIRAALNQLAAEASAQNADPPPPTNTPIPPPPPTNTPIPPPPPTNTLPPPPPPTNTLPPPPPPTNTLPPPPPPPTNTPVPPPPPAQQQPQVDAGLLAEVEAKIVRHRDVTGRDDLVAGFSAVRDAFLGNSSPDDALGAIKSGWNNDLWNRIRAALEAMK